MTATTRSPALGMRANLPQFLLLVAGWLIGIPVPIIVIWAPTWSWIVFANVLLGVNQGLTWSTIVIMKIDLAGPERRGLAMGLNEAAGYGAVAITAYTTGLIAQRWGLRPAPFFLGIAYAGLGLSLFAVRETHSHARTEADHHDLSATQSPLTCLRWASRAHSDERRPESQSVGAMFEGEREWVSLTSLAARRRP
ncbi:MAG TPA: MFS transporter [Acidimicrobiales bacterium]|nr:MFS transporter [Acidimicrobiales bacterium]